MSGSTLGGGSNSVVTTPLYYSSTTSPGYSEATSIIAAISSLFTSSQVRTVSVTASTSATYTATSSTPVLNVSSSLSTVTAANYSAVIDSSTGPETIYTTSTGGQSIVAGSGGGQIFVQPSAGTTTVAVGDGNYWIGSPGDTAGLNVSTGNGNDGISAQNGPSTINAGTGQDTIWLFEGNSNITLSGSADTIYGGVEGNTNAVAGFTDAGTSVTISVTSGVADNVFITENYADISFTNGTAASTILGAAGWTTIDAGGSGAVTWLGEDYSFFGTVALSTLTDHVTDNSSSNDTLVGGAGTSYIDASGSSGDVRLVTGSGDATLTGGGGTDTFQISELTTGSHSITIDNFTTSDYIDLQGFDVLPTVTTTTGGATFTLADGTTVTVNGDVSDLSSHLYGSN